MGTGCFKPQRRESGADTEVAQVGLKENAVVRGERTVALTSGGPRGARVL